MPNKKCAMPKQKHAPTPEPQYLKIEGDWQDAVKQAIQEKKPAGGWRK